MRFRHARGHPASLFQIGQRLIRLVLSPQQGASIDAWQNRALLSLDGLRENLHGCTGFAQLGQHDAQTVQRGRVGRLQRQRRLERAPGILKSSGILECGGQIDTGIDEVGLFAQRTFIGLDSRLETTGPTAQIAQVSQHGVRLVMHGGRGQQVRLPLFEPPKPAARQAAQVQRLGVARRRRQKRAQPRLGLIRPSRLQPLHGLLQQGEVHDLTPSLAIHCPVCGSTGQAFRAWRKGSRWSL